MDDAGSISELTKTSGNTKKVRVVPRKRIIPVIEEGTEEGTEEGNKYQVRKVVNATVMDDEGGVKKVKGELYVSNEPEASVSSASGAPASDEPTVDPSESVSSASGTSVSGTSEASDVPEASSTSGATSGGKKSRRKRKAKKSKTVRKSKKSKKRNLRKKSRKHSRRV